MECFVFPIIVISQNRNTLINIDLINTGGFDAKISEKVKKLYDGMNVLPYSNQQIAYAIKALFDIHIDFNEERVVSIEFGERESGKGYYSRSCIFEDDYGNLFRDDILECLNPEYIRRIAASNDIENHVLHSILKLRCDIRLVSDFNRFVDLYAKRIIPYQIYLNRQPLLFNPAHIKIFGRP